MLQVSKVTRRFRGAEDAILKDVSLVANAGDRVGIVGPNGAGKSTLLRLIAGDDQPDGGNITRNPPTLRVGYLAQGLEAPDDQTVWAVLFPQIDALRAAEADVARLAEALSTGDDSAAEAYSAALERLMQLGSVVDEGEGLRALTGVGLGDVPPETPVGQLSGGQKTRLMLAAVTVGRPDMLLLDEPTNHLDVDALRWLEGWLADFAGALLVVSHDRAFLDRIATHIVALPGDGSARQIVGNYSDYLALIEHERDEQWSQWKDQEVTIARMRQDISRTMSKAIKREKATQNDFQRRRAKVVAQKAKAKETRLRKYLESDERVEKPEQTWSARIDFDDLPRAHGEVVTLENAHIGYAGHPPLLRDISLNVRPSDRVAVMGPNGTGKSTLLKTVLGHLPPLAGHVRIGGGVQVGYLAQEQDTLQPDSTPLKTLQAEKPLTETEARSFLHFFLFSDDDPLRPNHTLSYGERARLMLALLVARGSNLLVMDEPLNHLDLPSRAQFEAALGQYPGSVLMVAHDRYFVDRFATHIWHVENGGVSVDYLAV